MFSQDELTALIKRVGLDLTDLQERSRFLGWQEADAARLKQAAPLLDRGLEPYFNKLAQHLAQFSDNRNLELCETSLQRLTEKKQAYYQKLWDGERDEDFIRNRVGVGLVHHKIGLEPHQYLGSFRIYLDQMLEQICGQNEQTELYSSLLKAVFLDISLALESYYASSFKNFEEDRQRFTRSMRGANDGIWEWDLKNDVLYLSDRWFEIVGLDSDAIANPRTQDWNERVHPDDRHMLRQAVRNHLSGRSSSLDHEYRIRKGDGEYIWVLTRGTLQLDEYGNRRISGTLADIHERKENEQKMSYAAFHDPLTGLPNRSRLDQFLHDAVQNNKINKEQKTALLFIDLDNFKFVNDNYGHNIGDMLLIEIARRLQQCLRPGDHLARFGGDEFVVLLNELSQINDAKHIAQRMLDTLQAPVHIQDNCLAMSASIGVTDLPHSDNPTDILQAADLALYQAKMAGKAQFALYTEGMQSAAQVQQVKQQALHCALSNQEFSLHYQPIFAVTEEQPRVVAVEALLRWNYQGECLEPKDFLSTLDAIGGLFDVGGWVFTTACKQVKQWQQEYNQELACAINLAPSQLKNKNLIQQVKNALHESGLKPEQLILEITEEQLQVDCLVIPKILRELADLGVRIALDDFGLGYASLGYLKRFPIHILKVDKQLISQRATDDVHRDVGQAIISLGHSLGLDVVAEGVEQATHLSFVQQSNCQYAQGYYLGTPVTAELFIQHLQCA